MKIIDTENMPLCNGHYSRCIERDGLLYLSGQLPIDHKTKSISESIAEQTEQALKNVELILNEAGSNKKNVLQTRIYLSDIDLWDEVNSVYSDFFETHKPVRSVVPTGELHYGCLIEIEVVAVMEV